MSLAPGHLAARLAVLALRGLLALGEALPHRAGDAAEDEVIRAALAAVDVLGEREELRLAEQERVLRAVFEPRSAHLCQLLQAESAVDLALPGIAQPHLLGDGFLVFYPSAAAARLLLLLPLEADQV